MKIMFLDESGNHALIGGDPAYPVFVLGGIIADADYVAEVIDPRIRRFKRDLFGREDLVLHTADITRNKNGFEQLKEPNFRKHFYEELNRLMMELEYMVVACVIKQDDVLARYGMAAVDPYLLSLDILVERFCFEIGDVPESGRIVAEKRSPVLDRELDIAWLNLKVQGTKFIKANTLNERITNLLTLPKSANVAGLQLADLVVSPIGRFVLGKPLKQDWAVVESKFRRQDGRYKGAGLVVLPDTEEMN